MGRTLTGMAMAMLACAGAQAAQAPAYDRPGIGFSTSTVGKGVFAWEQGLPDGSHDRRDGVTATTWTADTLLRLGVGRTLELQLGADTWGGQRLRGAGLHARAEGGGDGSIAVKWAPALDNDTLTVAFKFGTTLPWGQAPLGGDGQVRDLGVTVAWALPADAGLALHVDRQWGDDGGGWLFSPSYGFPLGEDVAAYVEAGYGQDEQHMRAAGAGLTWMATPRLQLDASFLRGLDEETADWQGGVGLALYFD
ncbi:transporter [Stenotrophomonas acidaminiphila]